MTRRMTTLLAAIALMVALTWPLSARAATPTPAELSEAQRWSAALFQGISAPATSPERYRAGEAFFSFQYGDVSSTELLKSWKTAQSQRSLDAQRTEHTLTYTDPKTGLEVRCVAVVYADFPTVEWTLYFKNGGASDTPILSEVQPLDLRLAAPQEERLMLHHWVGGWPADLQPRETLLKPNDELRFSPSGGRPTNSNLPNYNLELDNGGIIAVLGWPGQWATHFTREADGPLRVRGGQELTHFTLHPGEEIRTPLVVLQFYQGDWLRGQNLWRRWMVEHNLPRPGGQLPRPMLEAECTCLFGFWGATEENQQEFLSAYQAKGPKLDFWWIDLGWFEIDPATLIHSALYRPAPERFPRGLRPISDRVHEKGFQLMCWFEPEHVYPGEANWLSKNKPEWLLSAPPGHEQEINQGMPLVQRKVLDLGNPEALEWCITNTLRVLEEQGIDAYRHDFNIEPLIFWRNHDATDRQGITEIRYVTGFLRYYDELLRRKPGLLIDNCASGGQRNDLETLRRSLPLWRSDSAWDSDTLQTQTASLACWLPYFGTGVRCTDTYALRSAMCPSLVLNLDARSPEVDFNHARQVLEEQWRTVVAPNYFGDYYPLLPNALGADRWVAWQFDRPEEGRGVIQAFRRKEAPSESIRLKLHGLDPQAVYQVTNLDTPGVTELRGSELVTEGLSVSIAEQPGSAILHYQKKP